MKIRHIGIRNFRRIDKLDADFADRATVFIGLNGAGKSTLLAAIRKALSFVFSKANGKAIESTLRDGMPALKVEGYKRLQDLVINQTTRMPAAFIDIYATAEIDGVMLPEWHMYTKTSTFNLADSAYKDAFSIFYDKVILPAGEYPVLAYFSDGFPHIDLHRKSLSTGDILPRNMGYYAWNDYNSCLSVWLDRFKRSWLKCERLERQGAQQSPSYALLKREVSMVIDILRRFTAEDTTLKVTDCIVDEMTDEVSVVGDDGYSTPFTKLPAGYLRLLGICFDLTYRSLILNDIHDIAEARGIVLIDEVDLHLHPSLEANALPRLLSIFSNLQFIVSTHSPLVISNLNAGSNSGNAVCILSPNVHEPIRVPNFYGVDYNAVVRDGMKTPERNSDVDFLVNSFQAYKELGMQDAAKDIAEKLYAMLDADSPILKQLW